MWGIIVLIELGEKNMDKKSQSGNENIEVRDRVYNRLFDQELRFLVKYYAMRDKFGVQRKYMRNDPHLSSHKKSIIKSKQPAVALAYIVGTQTKYVEYLETSRHIRNRGHRFDFPERYHENGDYAKFENLIYKNGTYNQVKQTMTLLGTNAVEAGLAVYKKGQEEGVSHEQILNDLKESLVKRYAVERDLIDVTAYSSYNAVNYCTDKVKKEIIDRIMEARAEESFGLGRNTFILDE